MSPTHRLLCVVLRFFLFFLFFLWLVIECLTAVGTGGSGGKHHENNHRRCDQCVKASGSSMGKKLEKFWKPCWRNGSAPAYGAGGCGFDPHVGLFYFREGRADLCFATADGAKEEELYGFVWSQLVLRKARVRFSAGALFLYRPQ